MNDTILITGGLGFIGHHLIRRLLRDTDTRISIVAKRKSSPSSFSDLLSSRVTIIQGDVREKAIIEDAVSRASIVIHLAAVHSPSTPVQEMLNINVIGTANILEACTMHPVKKMIYMSSAGVYGESGTSEMIDESDPLSPINPYAISKMAAERLLYYYFLTKKFPVVTIRPFNVYGPGQQVSQMVPLFITRLLAGQSIYLNHSGMQKRDWIFVDDVISAIMAILTCKNSQIIGETFNIGTGRSNSVLQVVKLIMKLLNADKSLIINKYDAPREVTDSIADCTKIKTMLGWKPIVSLSEGLEKTVNWYRERISF